ncbi:MAG: hypothetical protein A4E57_03834 [Syntrophorhabdaceae bacterium PtaU1.Bin034]|nr:MAG: hypothetical protein A4E57_03834 [Syntrophorhabdaceae bacterium PtaU1.Bin034]
MTRTEAGGEGDKKSLPAGIRVVPNHSNEIIRGETALVRRDRAIEADILQVVSGNVGISGVKDVRLWVDGGVAHLRGFVQNESEQFLLRRLVGMVRGVHAVWDLLERPGRRPLNVLDIGCGTYKQSQQSVGVDRFIYPPVDVVTDLETSLPFGSNTIDHIFAVHVLEHINELVSLMNEIHRVLRHDGVLHVMVPYWHHAVAVADPTHVRFFVPQSFKLFCQRTPFISPFRPLTVSCNSDTVFADLIPDKEGAGADDDEIVRHFL